MNKLIGSKELEISDEKLLKIFRSAAIIQCFISLYLLIFDTNFNYINLFVIYNIFIWGTYLFIKLNFKNILKYNVHLLFLVLNVIPTFLCLMVLFIIINNIIIDILLFVTIFSIYYIVSKKKLDMLKDNNQTQANRFYMVIIGVSLVSIIKKITKDNVIFDQIMLLLSMIVFYGLMFYMLRLVKIYENSK